MQRLANLADRGVHGRLHIDEDVLPPQALDDLVAGDELTAPLDQEDQQIHRQALEAHRLPVAPQLVGGDIELEAAEAIGSRTGGCHGLAHSVHNSAITPADCGACRSYRKGPDLLQPASMVKRPADGRMAPNRA